MPYIGTCFRFYTQMRVEKNPKHLHIEFIVTSHNSVSLIGRNRELQCLLPAASKTLKLVSKQFLKLKAYCPDMYTVEFTRVEKIFINHAALVPDKKVPIYWHAFFSYFSAKNVKRI